MLVAVGRVANLTGYGLEELGIATGRTIETNEWLQTRYPNIYAVGDVAGPYQFTHTAAHQAWYAAVNALFSGFKRFKADYRVIPWVTFTSPEVARVGLSEEEAKAQGIAFEVTRYGLDDLDRAIADGDAHGFVKVITPKGKDRILGATIVGEHAGELLAEFTLAMKHGLGLNKILGTIHPYPTWSEADPGGLCWLGARTQPAQGLPRRPRVGARGRLSALAQTPFTVHRTPATQRAARHPQPPAPLPSQILGLGRDYGLSCIWCGQRVRIRAVPRWPIGIQHTECGGFSGMLVVDSV